MSGRIFFRDRVTHAPVQFIAQANVLGTGEFDKAARKIGVVGGKRRLDIVRDRRSPHDEFSASSLSWAGSSCAARKSPRRRMGRSSAHVNAHSTMPDKPKPIRSRFIPKTRCFRPALKCCAVFKTQRLRRKRDRPDERRASL